MNGRHTGEKKKRKEAGRAKQGKKKEEKEEKGASGSPVIRKFRGEQKFRVKAWTRPGGGGAGG